MANNICIATRISIACYDYIGTDVSKNKVCIFKNADQSVLLSNLEELLDGIVDFVELYKKLFQTLH